MLSKSQARLFYLTATVGFSGVFLWLTFDTMRQVPERSNEDQLTAQVVAGKEIWETNNCMGCHTLLGEGAYYAPELTKVIERRGKPWLRVFLKDPEAMYPGRRRMVQYDFTDDEIEEVLAFFEWVGGVDTNGFPAEPDMRPAGMVSTAGAGATASAAPATFSTICVGCHQLDGVGGQAGPALDGVGDRYDPGQMRAWLADPQSVKPGTTMPNLALSSADLDALTNFLIAQKSGAAGAAGEVAR
jgi:nitric oxide reductase subunit C